MENLWPNNINQVTHKITPKEFLNEQINFLSKATNGKLQGTLSSFSTNSSNDIETEKDFTGEIFIHSMKIVSPSLGYSFTLLRVAHQTIKIFPISIFSNLTDKKYSVKDLDEFGNVLKEIFSSAEVVEAISSIASQSSPIEDLPF